jgi:hypothetical protein
MPKNGEVIINGVELSAAQVGHGASVWMTCLW